MRIKNVSGGEIVQVFEGKVYRWPKNGSVMTLPDGVGAWMMSHLNSADWNPALKALRLEKNDPKLMAVEFAAPKPGDQEFKPNEIVAEDPPEEKPAAPVRSQQVAPPPPK